MSKFKFTPVLLYPSYNLCKYHPLKNMNDKLRDTSKEALFWHEEVENTTNLRRGQYSKNKMLSCQEKKDQQSHQEKGKTPV